MLPSWYAITVVLLIEVNLHVEVNRSIYGQPTGLNTYLHANPLQVHKYTTGTADPFGLAVYIQNRQHPKFYQLLTIIRLTLFLIRCNYNNVLLNNIYMMQNVLLFILCQNLQTSRREAIAKICVDIYLRKKTGQVQVALARRASNPHTMFKAIFALCTDFFHTTGFFHYRSTR